MAFAGVGREVTKSLPSGGCVQTASAWTRLAGCGVSQGGPGLRVLSPRRSWARLAICPAVQSWPWACFRSGAATDSSETSPCPLISNSLASIKMWHEGLWPYYFPLYVHVCKEDNSHFFKSNQLKLPSCTKMNHIKLKSSGLDFQRIWT